MFRELVQVFTTLIATWVTGVPAAPFAVPLRNTRGAHGGRCRGVNGAGTDRVTGVPGAPFATPRRTTRVNGAGRCSGVNGAGTGGTNTTGAPALPFAVPLRCCWRRRSGPPSAVNGAGGPRRALRGALPQQRRPATACRAALRTERGSRGGREQRQDDGGPILGRA